MPAVPPQTSPTGFALCPFPTPTGPEGKSSSFSASFRVQATCGFMGVGRRGGEGIVLEVVTVKPDGNRADTSGRGQAPLPPCSWLVRGCAADRVRFPLV